MADQPDLRLLAQAHNTLSEQYQRLAPVLNNNNAILARLDTIQASTDRIEAKQHMSAYVVK